MRSKLGRILLLASATFLLTAYVAMPGAHAAAKPKCFGKTATIVSGKSTINGTKHADVIVATGKGQHKINGGGGNDLICGGVNADSISGGPGNDKINGGRGDDGTPFCLGAGALSGGPGNDTIIGGAGSDCLFGGAGNDNLVGGTGDDTLYPGTGTADKVDGGTNGNPLQGTGLGDTASFSDMSACVVANLTTGKETSPCASSRGMSGRARAGAAVASSGTLTNIENLFGSPANDTLVGNANGGATPNGLEGGLGDDTLNGGGGLIEIAAYLLAPAGVTVNMGIPGQQNGSATGGEGNDTLMNITGVAGSNFDDTITGGNILFGGGGNDTITAGASNDIIFGDAQTPATSDGNDTISAGDGNDSVTGGGGNDNMDGGAGTDAGDGGPGTDTCKNFETSPSGGTGPTGCEA